MILGIKKYSPPLIAAFILFIVFFIAFFYESERIQHYLTSINVVHTSNFENENFISRFVKGVRKSIWDFLLNIATFIEDLKRKTNLKNFYEKEKNSVNSLSESPLLFKNNKTDLIKQNKTNAYRYIKYSKPESSNGQNRKLYSINNKIKNTSDNINPEYDKNLGKTIFNEKEYIKVFGFSPPYRFLIIGDSMIQSPLGISLEKKLMEIPNSYVFKKCFASTGLLRPDYFNWPMKINKYIRRYNPNIIIIMLGTVDSLKLFIEGSKRNENIIGNYITKELIPYVNNNLPAIGKQSISGVSIGGYCALSLSRDYPKKIKQLLYSPHVIQIMILLNF